MRVIIVHRWDGKPNSDWYQWLKKELEKKGFSVEIPNMPNTAEPEIGAWISHLKKVVGNSKEDVFFVGHSIGCQTIMRYLEHLSSNKKAAPKKLHFVRNNIKIAGIVFVAGWLKLENLEDDDVKALARPWIETPINFDKVKEKTKNITVFLSSNDPYGAVKENEKIFKKNLGANIIIEKNKGHFLKEDGITKVPEVLEELKKWFG